jgi:hypothetical protein
MSPSISTAGRTDEPLLQPLVALLQLLGELREGALTHHARPVRALTHGHSRGVRQRPRQDRGPVALRQRVEQRLDGRQHLRLFRDGRRRGVAARQRLDGGDLGEKG